MFNQGVVYAESQMRIERTRVYVPYSELDFQTGMSE